MPIPTIWQSDFNVTASGAANSSSFLAASPDGRYSLAYNADADFVQRAFDGAGTHVADLTIDPTSNDDSAASSAFLSSGFVITVWSSDTDGAGALDIYFQVRGGAGLAYPQIVPPTLANPGYTSNVEMFPLAVPLANGSFALSWFDSGNLIYTASYEILGNPISPPVVIGAVNGVSLSHHAAARASMIAFESGGYAIGYADASGAARMSIHDHQAAILAAEVDLFPGSGEEGIAGIAQLADGRIVAAAGKAGAAGILIRFFSEAGSALSPVIDLALPGIDQEEDYNPRIAALHDGRFLVVTSAANENALNADVWAVVVNANGTIDGTPFQVNDPVVNGTGSQSAPAVATLADGRVIVSWTDNQSGNGDVWTKIYDPRETGLRGGATGQDDDWYGTSFSDTIFLGAGKDAFHGGGSADFIFGEAGSDTLYGEASDDRIDGGTGADTLAGGTGNDVYYVDNTSDDVQELVAEGIDTVRSTVDYLLGANEDKLYLLAGAVTGTGNSLSNFIFGNANSNMIDGSSGADRLYGDRGDDVYSVDSAGDLVFETIAGTPGGIDLVVASVNHTLSNNVENLTLTGGNVNGTGNGLANIILGSAGNNFIDGKLGNDTLTGGNGIDQFVFATALNASTNADVVTDFNAAEDFLRLDDAIFTQIGLGFLSSAAFVLNTAATAAQHRIVYNSTTGDVFYDRDGAGGAAQVRFANIGAGTVLTEADIFVF